jgi:hypothetical protein
LVLEVARPDEYWVIFDIDDFRPPAESLIRMLKEPKIRLLTRAAQNRDYVFEVLTELRP